MGEDKAIKNNNFIGIMSFKVKIITFPKALALGAHFPKPFVQYVIKEQTYT